MTRRSDSPARRRPNRREFCAALALTLLATGGFGAPSGGALAQMPERIVAAGGAITEVLYALGLEGKLVGVDTTSQFPAEALKDKAGIGYVRALSAEGILSLKPSLVLAIDGAGPPSALSLVGEAGVRLFKIPDDTSADGVVAKIEAIGNLAGAAEPARRLAAQTRAGFDDLTTLRTGLAVKRRVLFVLSLQNGRIMVGGRNSTADAIIGLAGGVNVASAIEGYKPMSEEAILAAAPDAILMMRNSASHNTTTDELFMMPAFARTPAAARRAHIAMDGLYLLGFGPRTPAAARDLMAAIYPEITIPPLKTASPVSLAARPSIPKALPSLAAFAAGRRRLAWLSVTGLALACLVLAIVAIGQGAVAIAPGQVVDILLAKLTGGGEILNGREALVVLNIRLPRVLLGMLVGAALAISGALMQGLFRNPLADPGLVGVSAGAGLAAAATIVLGDRVLAGTAAKLPFALLPAGAFCGGLISTLALYLIATRQGRTSIPTMLLAGVALGALAGALTGLLAFLSDDRQLRDLTFWSLGSLGGASWGKLSVVAPIVLPLMLAVPLLARGLNALMLGEAEAYHLGLAVQRIKALTILLVALAVGAGVAAAGVIGFVGIVVPHLVRLLVGPDHRLLLPLSALGGAALLVGADIVARLVVAPAELPIGIVTAGIGAPFFLWLLLRHAGHLDV